jgi:chemotaxis protein MotA
MSDTANDPIQSFTAKSDLPLRLEPARQSLDMATVLGLLGAVALIGIAIALGGNWTAFIDVPSILIVIIGTFAITTVSYSWREVMQAQPLMMRTAFSRGHNPNEAAAKVLQLAERARRRGLLAMQNELFSLKNEPFLLRGMTMLVDGMPIEEIERNLTFETHAMAQRHQRSTGILRRAAEVSPAMGLIGTLIGLVQMLGSLDQPEGIGPAMAVALLTTFYGAVLANVVFLPVASKLERNSAIELLINQIFILGALSIGRQENPRRLELVLNTILPANQRVKYFD